jgi:hypothetical protein
MPRSLFIAKQRYEQVNELKPHHPLLTALLLKDIGKRFYERRQVIFDAIGV